jgi:DNA-binding transcriptional LysR family regulator
MDGWQGVDAFVAIAETGSLTRAAARLDLSISQVSRELKRLEARLGTPLIARTTRRLALTDAGRLFEERFRQLIDDRDAAFEEVGGGKDAMQGHLRLTCAVAYGERTIVPIVNRFVRRHPQISIDIELTNHVRDLVAEGLDLAIRIGETADRRLRQTRLGSRSLHVVASPDYLENRGTPTTIDALHEHACLLGTAEHWLFSPGGRDLRIRPQSRWHCNSGFAVLDAALQGLGICQLPDFYVQPHLASGALTEILIEDRPRDQGIWATFPDRGHLQLRLTSLIDFLQQSLGSPA